MSSFVNGNLSWLLRAPVSMMTTNEKMTPAENSSWQRDTTSQSLACMHRLTMISQSRGIRSGIVLEPLPLAVGSQSKEANNTELCFFVLLVLLLYAPTPRLACLLACTSTCVFSLARSSVRDPARVPPAPETNHQATNQPTTGGATSLPPVASLLDIIIHAGQFVLDSRRQSKR